MALRPAAGPGRLTSLDGLRAVAVAMVMAYHGGVAGFRTAGFFGVDVFFVLSGFLITTLLLEEQSDSGEIHLGGFWGRRARRLLPGLLVMLVAVDLYVAYGAPAGRYPGFRGDALSVVAYFSNWHFIAVSSNYFAATGVPSLLTHTWSLAIEEQFYLLWPLVLIAAAWVGRRVRRRPATVVLALAAAGAVASAGWMAALYRSGTSASRLYFGTDTHAQSILIGAALAGVFLVWPALPRRIPALPAGVLAGAGLLWAATSLGYSDPATYQGGFLLVALFSALLISALVAHPAGPPAKLLSAPPLVYLGRISYGMYLWYFPLFAVLDHSRTGLTGPALFALRCVADVAVAAVSFHLLEEPVRRWRRPPRRATARGAGRLAPLATGVAAVAGVAALVLADTPAAFSAAGLPDASTGPGVAGAGVGGAGTSGTAATAPPLPGSQRILVVGDSTGTVLGIDLALSPVEQRYRIDVRTAAIIGCGIVDSAEVLDHGNPLPSPAACNTATSPDRTWPAQLQADINRYKPQVVLVVAGRWETKDRRQSPTSPWTNITQPADAAYVRAQLELATRIASSAGARVGLATSPCFSSGEQPSGEPWPEDNPNRIEAYNRLVRSVAAAHPATATVVDLFRVVCPDGRYHQTLDGIDVRGPDGIHYPLFSIAAPDSPDPDTIAQARQFGLWIAPRILPALRPPSG